MKQFLLFFLSLVLVPVMYAQKNTGNSSVANKTIMDTTTTLLKGTYAKGGRIYLQPGYKFKTSADKKVVTVMAMTINPGNNVSGSYACTCWSVAAGRRLTARPYNVL